MCRSMNKRSSNNSSSELKDTPWTSDNALCLRIMLREIMIVEVILGLDGGITTWQQEIKNRIRITSSENGQKK